MAWHGAATETIVFLDVFEIAGNLKSCQKDAKLVKLVLTRTVWALGARWDDLRTMAPRITSRTMAPTIARVPLGGWIWA